VAPPAASSTSPAAKAGNSTPGNYPEHARAASPIPVPLCAWQGLPREGDASPRGSAGRACLLHDRHAGSTRSLRFGLSISWYTHSRCLLAQFLAGVVTLAGCSGGVRTALSAVNPITAPCTSVCTAAACARPISARPLFFATTVTPHWCRWSRRLDMCQPRRFSRSSRSTSMAVLRREQRTYGLRDEGCTGWQDMYQLVPKPTQPV
jgi:hypothetical protein